MGGTAHRGATLRELARALGLAEGSVSRALNGYPNVSAETRERVLREARRLGYEPSSSARRLARGVTDTIGIVLPQRLHREPEPFLFEFLDGLGRALAAHQRDLLVASCGPDEDEQATHRRLVSSGKVDGFVLVRTQTVDPRVDLLRISGVPFVTFGRTRDPEDYAWVDTDNEQGTCDAVKHLAALGHQRVALVAPGDEMNFAKLRRAGYRKGLMACGLAVDDRLDVEADLSGQAAEAAVLRLLETPDQPTAILCGNDLMAIGTIKAIRTRGLHVGTDVSVIGYDGLPIGEVSDPPLTTIAHDIGEAGHRTAVCLEAVLSGEEPNRHQHLLPARLVRRATDGPPEPRNRAPRSGTQAFDTTQGGLK